MPAHLGGRARRLGSELDQRLERLRSDVVDHHGITGLPDIPRNRTAYGAQTNEADGFHCRTP
jgi:hypothetical protein